jgi:transcriptional regulator with XRE-family HTH domain
LRLRRGWTQEALGERSGLSYKFVGEIERGTANPTIDSLEMIAKAFALDVEDLLKREGGNYSVISADDFAILREAGASLNSIQDVIRRMGIAGRSRPKRSRRRR